MLADVTSVGMEARSQTNSQLAPQFGFGHPVKTIMNAAQNPTTPTTCLNWLELGLG
jgi:hypothetical protein